MDCSNKGSDVIKYIVTLIAFLLAAAPAIAAPETPSEFADWFIEQGFEGQEYYEWVAVLDALVDGIDRSREPAMEVNDPVYVAIRTGTKYHKQGCSSLKTSTKVLELDRAEALERGFEACSRCSKE